MWKFSKTFFIYEVTKSLLSLISIFSVILLPKEIIDSLGSGHYEKTIFIVIVFTMIVTSVGIATNWIDVRCQKVNKGFQEELVLVLAHKTSLIPYSEVESYEYREKYELACNSISRDSVTKVLQYILSLTTTFFTIIGVAYIASYLQWWLFIALVIYIVIGIICEVVRSKYNHDSYESQNTAEMNMLYFRDWMPHKDYAKEVRLYNMPNYILKNGMRWIKRLAEIQKQRASRTFKALWWSHLADGFMIILIYTYVGYLCLKGTLSVGAFFVSVAAVFELSRSCVNIAKAFLTFTEEGQYVQSYISLTNCEDDLRDHKVDFNTLHTFSFNNVSFQYPSTTVKAINNISVTLKPGKRYGIVGKNGAGKSTFVKLLMGLYNPSEGSVTCNGVNVSDINQQEYWKLFSALFQDYKIFSLSVEENISLEVDARLDKCHDAAKEAGILDKIMGLPKDYKTVISREFHEDGVELSTGEQQKLALARLIYKDAPVLIFDEPTASLSPQSEYMLYRSFESIAKGKTVFYISHRLASCRLCDEIIVFDNGRIIEQGSHEELITANGYYKELFYSQSKYYQEDFDQDSEGMICENM